MSERGFRREREQQARRHAKRRRRRALALSTGAVGVAAFAAPAAQADEFSVTNLDNDGDGSLREAIEDANGNAGVDDIVFQSGLTGTIMLESQLLITDPVNVHGPGAGVISVSGQDNSRVFDIALGGPDIRGLQQDGGAGRNGGGEARGVDGSDIVSISGLSIVDGLVSDGGAGILNENADLILSSSVVSGNTIVSSEDGYGFGAGIDTYPFAGLTIQNSTISDNSIEYASNGERGLVGLAGFGGGVYVHFGIDAEIVNSTISGNSAGLGGGLFVNNSVDGDVDISNSTIADNDAAISGGGIYRKYGDGPGRGPGSPNTNLLSTIVGDNSAPSGPDLGEQVSTESSRFNAAFSLIETTSGATVNQTGPNVTGQDPQLGLLANNGGPTETHLPAATSPARDQGVADGLTTDQRGQARTEDDAAIANAAGGDGTDIGSVELLQSSEPGPETRPAPLTKRGCQGETATIVGTTGNDVIVGTDGRDVIRGLRGKDVIRGLGGDDLICGDGNRDKIKAGAGDDKVKGGNAGDRIFGGKDDDILRGGAGVDRIFGRGGDDQMFGGAKLGPKSGPARGKSPGNVCDGDAGTDTASGCETVRDVP